MTLQAGYEPLLEAISTADIPALERLLTSNQFSVNTEIPYQSEDGKPYIITPLYWAVKVGQKDVCRYLLQKNADPYRHMVYEYYPLHEACSRGDHEIVQEFIYADCNVNQPNCDGDTPLHIASMRGHINCIRLLLNAGGDPRVRNLKGETPLQAAQYTNQTDLYKLFEVYEKENSTNVRWRSNVSRHHRPLSSSSSMRHPVFRHSYGSQDDTAVAEVDTHIRRNKSDIGRTFSFSGSEASRYQYPAGLMAATRERPRYKSNLTQQQHALTNRPGLVNMSHDSQLVLPTQNLISDPRRTQTYHDFGNSLPPQMPSCVSAKVTPEESHGIPLSPADEVESDSLLPCQQQGLGPKLRVRHMLECLNQAVVKKYGKGFDSSYIPLLSSIHRDLDFTAEEYDSLQLLVGDFCVGVDKRPSSDELASKESTNQIEYVWGCDYEMTDRSPFHVVHGTPTVNYAEMVFKVRLHPQESPQSHEFALLKVIAHIFDLGDKIDSTAYHSNSYSAWCAESQIFKLFPPHPNIVQLLHHCPAHSRPFERFTRLFCSDEAHASLKMAPQVSLLFLKERYGSFESYLSSKKQMQPVTPYGIEERTALLFLVQLFLAMSHLDQYGILVSYLTPGDIQFDDSHHLILTGLSHALDVGAHKDPALIQAHLQEIADETLLTFSPELALLRDCSSTTIAKNPPLDFFLRNSNSFAAARLFLDIFTDECLLHKTTDDYPELTCFSSNLKNLVKKVVSLTHEDRPTAFQAAMCCFVLLFGPSKSECATLSDCQQWLVSETCHFFLSPSLKGQPSFYSKDITTKLLFTYLLIVTPESLHSATQLIYSSR